MGTKFEDKELHDEIMAQFNAKEARTAFANENRIKFGEYYTAYGVPCIELIRPDGKKVYLSAFRRYAFQVSGTRDGEWALGETPVFGLETLGTIIQTGCSNLGQDSTEKYIIGAVAMDAVNSYCYREDYYPPSEYFSVISDDKVEWNKFIENTRRFLKHNDGAIEIVNDEHVKPKEKEAAMV